MCPLKLYRSSTAIVISATSTHTSLAVRRFHSDMASPWSIVSTKMTIASPIVSEP